MPSPLPSASALFQLPQPPITSLKCPEAAPVAVNWTLETLHAAGPLVGVLVGGALSAMVTYLVWKRQAKQAEDLQAKQHTRARLLDRLALQKETVIDYQRVIADLQTDDPERKVLEGIQETLTRRKAKEKLAYQESNRLMAKIDVAFGNRVFAHQATDCVAGLAGSNISEPSLTFTTLIAPRALSEMTKAIEATERQVDDPKRAYVPTLGGEDEYTEARTKALIHQIGSEVGADPKRIEEVLERARKKKPSTPPSNDDGTG